MHSARSNNRPTENINAQAEKNFVWSSMLYEAQFDPGGLWGKLIRKDLAEEIAEKLKQDDEEGGA